MKISDSMRLILHFSLKFAAVAFLYIVLVIPNRLLWMTPLSFVYFPLELIVLGFVLLLPGRVGRLLRGFAIVLLAAGIIFKIADIAVYQVFSRPFNPVFDVYLLADGMNLLKGAIGAFGAFLVAVLLLVLVVAIIVLVIAVVVVVQGMQRNAPVLTRTTLLAGLVVWTLLSLTDLQRTSHSFYDQLADHTTDIINSIADINYFRSVVNIDAYRDVKGDSLFTTLEGKDVLIVFLESYGRTVLDNPEFEPEIRKVLSQGSADLSANGLFARSTYMTSPTVGGISWLAHGTALSGLWINSQVRYDSLMNSERPSLNRLFKRAGWRTVALMPAITTQWPEAEYFGYDQIYAAQDLGYQGLPFNWVTMPDQYVLSAFQKSERTLGTRAPVMAEMALISSHAPWTPLPQLVDWEAVGAGTIFNVQTTMGDAPEVVWKNTTRIREQYRLSIEYAMSTLVSFSIKYGGDDLVILIIGDHQPAPLVTGDTDNHDVPIHLITSDPEIMAAIADWNWTDGLVPAANAPVWRMDELRNRFVEAFSETNF